MTDKKDINDKKVRQPIKKIFKNNVYIIGRVIKCCPGLFVFWISDGVLYGVFNSIDTLYVKLLFDSIDQGKSFQSVLLVICGMALISLIVYAFHAIFTDYFKPQLEHKLHYEMQKELFEKAQSIDVSCYDDPVFYNDFVFAMDEADARAKKALEDTGKLINRVIASITIISVILSINVGLAVVVVFANIVAVAFNIWGNKVNFKHQKEGKPLWRKGDYIRRVFYLAEYAKELRISRISENLFDEYDKNNQAQRDMQMRYGKKYFVIYGSANLIRQIIFSGVLLWMTYLLMVSKTIMLGGFAAATNALWRLTWLLTDMMDRLIKYPEHSLYIDKYRSFLAYEPKIKSGENVAESFEEIGLSDVTFSYGFSEVAPDKKATEEIKEEKAPSIVLKNVNMTIHKGDKIAIVGYNGAGKTTLIKLLMRLYDVSTGEISWNGKNIRTFEIESFRGHIGAVFQDYKIFSATVAENVLGGDYDGSEECICRVRSALKAATFDEKLADLEKNNKGLDTILSREFDKKGVNLSGGEAQKIAIARVFARPFDLIIMDEPSSALDPIAEFELNRSILNQANDKTVIFISHRLSTTRMADKIYMFAGGEVIEQGSHNELMGLDGKYAHMFNLQAEKYKSGQLTGTEI